MQNMKGYIKYEADVMADHIWLKRDHGNPIHIIICHKDSPHSFTHINQFGFS